MVTVARVVGTNTCFQKVTPKDTEKVIHVLTEVGIKGDGTTQVQDPSLGPGVLN